MRMDGVEIDRRVTAPRPVVGKVDTPALVRCRTRRAAAQPHADVVMHARPAALGVDERAAHLSVAGVVPGAAADLCQLVALEFCQNNTLHGAPWRDGLIVHLIQQPRAVVRYARPSALRALAVGRADVKLDDLAVGLRRDRCRKLLRTGSRHRQFPEIGFAVEPVKKLGADPGRRLVDDASGDRHRVGGSRHSGRVNRVENHRRQVGEFAGVGPAGGAAPGHAGVPILPVIIGQTRLHQLERVPAAAVRRAPNPAAMAAVQRAANAPSPVALRGVAHLVCLRAGGIDEPDGFAVVGELALPVAGDIFDAGMQFGEPRRVGCNDQSAVGRQRDFAERKPDAGVELPAVEIDRLAAEIPKLDELLRHRLVGGAVVNLVDEHLRLGGSCGGAE